jgi:hypothetical protein
MTLGGRRRPDAPADRRPDRSSPGPSDRYTRDRAAYDGFRGTAGHRPVGLAAVAGRGRRRGAGHLRASRRRALAEPRDGSRPRPGRDAVAVAAAGRPRRPDAAASGPPAVNRRDDGRLLGGAISLSCCRCPCCRCRRVGRTSRSAGSSIRKCGVTATPVRPPAPSRAGRSVMTSTRSSRWSGRGTRVPRRPSAAMGWNGSGRPASISGWPCRCSGFAAPTSTPQPRPPRCRRTHHRVTDPSPEVVNHRRGPAGRCRHELGRRRRGPARVHPGFERVDRGC